MQEELTELEEYIDSYYEKYNMDPVQHPEKDNPNKRKKTSSTDTSDLPTAEVEVSVLTSINKKLDLLVTLHSEIKELRASLEFAHNHIEKLEQANTSLQTTVKDLGEKMNSVIKDNKNMKETILDLQTRSMRDNIIFTGIPEKQGENPEELVKDFMKTQLKLPNETVNEISFVRVHRLGRRKDKPSRPIVAKLEHYNHKQIIKSRGRELKGTNYGVNDQFPREINERRKVLYPIMKQQRLNNKRAYIIVDKLFVDGQLYRDANTTPWLY